MRTILLLLVILATGCLSHKKAGAGTDPFASDRTVKIQFHPFWGGMAACELERKSGKDNLLYTYIVRKPMGDSTYSASAPVTKAQADSVFAQAERTEWSSDIFFGKADAPVGLTVYGEYKKGMQKKNFTCEKLINASELPKEIFRLATLLNELAPADMKLF
jgi:hypothetical protein